MCAPSERDIIKEDEQFSDIDYTRFSKHQSLNPAGAEQFDVNWKDRIMNAGLP